MSQLKTSVPERTERPHGQPGEVRTSYRTRTDVDGQRFRVGNAYPAVLMPNGSVVFWRDTETGPHQWITAPRRLAGTFEPGPEWLAQCPHMHGGVPHRWCSFEADCIALLKGEPRD